MIDNSKLHMYPAIFYHFKINSSRIFRISNIYVHMRVCVHTRTWLYHLLIVWLLSLYFIFLPIASDNIQEQYWWRTGIVESLIVFLTAVELLQVFLHLVWYWLWSLRHSSYIVCIVWGLFLIVQHSLEALFWRHVVFYEVFCICWENHTIFILKSIFDLSFYF